MFFFLGGLTMKFRMWGLSVIFIGLVLASVVCGPVITAGSMKKIFPSQLYVNPADVVWITRTGGLPSSQVYSVLYPGSDRAKIYQIVAMLNRSAGIRPATQQEVDSHGFGYPVDLVVRMRDRTYYVQGIMDITESQTAAGLLRSGRVDPSSFMLLLDIGDGAAKYYTLYSTEVPQYLMKGADADIPRHVTPAPPLTEQPLVEQLIFLTGVPVVIPQYWPPVPPAQSGQAQYYGLQYNGGPDGYSVNIYAISERLSMNSPALNDNSTNRAWGSFGGGVPGSFAPSFVVEKPQDGTPFVVDGYNGWETPVSFYWESGGWRCEVLSSSGNLMNDARALAGSFKESGELQTLQSKSGKILVNGDGNRLFTSISWVTSDGQYEYGLQYAGNIADAVKIADSFTGLQ
jgi:hypothetical protein